MKAIHKSSYFYGNKISDYGIANGYLDYSTLSKAFDAVLVNDITKLFYMDIGGEYNEPDQVNGYMDNDDGEYNEPDIYQYYIVSDQGARIIQEYTDDPLYYLPVIDCYVWGVTHYGTSWDYVLTDVKIELNGED